MPRILEDVFLYGELQRLLKESVHRGIFKGRTMFNVPGFRMNTDDSVRTDGAISSRPTSYIPVGWTPNADAYGNAEVALGNSYGPSYWSDVRNGMPWLPLMAAAGDTLHALEKGHNVIDAIGHGVAGTPPR